MSDKTIIAIEKLTARMERGFKQTDARIEKLAGLVADGYSEIDERFDAIELEMRVGFTELKQICDRIDTRLAALEHAVFGASLSGPTKDFDAETLIRRLEKLEKAVYKK